MNYTINSSWLQKKGYSPLEYEDALYPETMGSYNKKHVTVAVSDGASESMLSGKWAEFLVRSCCKKNYCFDNISHFIDRAYRGWNLWKSLYISKRKNNSIPIQWYEEEGLNAGAFASLLCLKLVSDQSNWDAVALGDSCLFQIRDNVLITSFPITGSSQFNNRPYLLSSNPTNNKHILKHVKKLSGHWQKNDTFFLMTDALAAPLVFIWLI